MPARPTSIKRPLKAKSAVELHSVAQDGKPTPQPRHKEGNAGEGGGVVKGVKFERWNLHLVHN